jgi:hypothetical protein
MRALPILLVAILGVAALPAGAQAPDSENGRYSFHQVTEGVLRLDTRTGHVSLCAKQASGYSCSAVPDDRTAMESEIARLQRENGTLKKEMLARGVPLPGGVSGDSPATSSREFNLRMPLPSDAEIDRMMSVFEKMWRRLVDMVKKDENKI